MKPTTRIAIAQLLSAAGSVLSAFAAEFNGEEVATGPIEGHQKLGGTPVDPPTVKRGRKAATTATDTTGEATGATATGAPAEPESAKQVVTKTYEDMKGVIKPLVEAGRGAEVKATIAKFAPSLREMDPSHYAAFEAAIAALPAEKPEEY